MRNCFRRCAAVLATAVLIASLAHPALAVERMYDVGDRTQSVPMLFDILFMRPVGLLMTVAGTMFYIFPVAPMMALVRPSDLGKPLDPLIVVPGRFTFGDPIGQHPAH